MKSARLAAIAISAVILSSCVTPIPFDPIQYASQESIVIELVSINKTENGAVAIGRGAGGGFVGPVAGGFATGFIVGAVSALVAEGANAVRMRKARATAESLRGFFGHEVFESRIEDQVLALFNRPDFPSDVSLDNEVTDPGGNPHPQTRIDVTYALNETMDSVVAQATFITRPDAQSQSVRSYTSIAPAPEEISGKIELGNYWLSEEGENFIENAGQAIDSLFRLMDADLKQNIDHPEKPETTYVNAVGLAQAVTLLEESNDVAILGCANDFFPNCFMTAPSNHLLTADEAFPARKADRATGNKQF